MKRLARILLVGFGRPLLKCDGCDAVLHDFPPLVGIATVIVVGSVVIGDTLGRVAERGLVWWIAMIPVGMAAWAFWFVATYMVFVRLWLRWHGRCGRRRRDRRLRPVLDG